MNSIKYIKFIRRLAKPYVDWRRRKEHEKYLHSPDHYYLKTMKGIHEGKRCFIIGNGPSLRSADLDMLKGEYTFASNRIFKIFDQTSWRPTYYLSVDDRVLKEIQPDLVKHELGHMFLKYTECTLNLPTNKLTKIYDRNLVLNINGNFHKNTSIYVSEDVSDIVCDGGTVTFNALQLAIYMGFKELYLLGVDNKFSHTIDASGHLNIDTSVQDYFDGGRYADGNLAAIDKMEFAYVIAKEYCDTHGIKIYNATRGGRLEVFERVNLDELFKQ